MGSKYKGTKDEVRALSAFINLMRAGDSLVDRTQKHYETEGLTRSQFGVLEALYHLGPLCQIDLAGKLLRSGASITSVLDNLEQRDLVERVRSKEDRRVINVELTKEGKKTLERALKPLAAEITKQMGALSAKEQDALRELCRRVGRQEK